MQYIIYVSILTFLNIDLSLFLIFSLKVIYLFINNMIDNIRQFIYVP